MFRKGYIHTTVLVDSGIYGIVRHPLYLAGILISISLPMISQHWLVAVFGLFAMVIYYQNTFDEERTCMRSRQGLRGIRQRVPESISSWVSFV
jgi:protein-S-isoprenylcysteine O-methyltransferase Ste14